MSENATTEFVNESPEAVLTGLEIDPVEGVYDWNEKVETLKDVEDNTVVTSALRRIEH